VSVSESGERNPYVTTGLVCAKRLDGKSSEEIAKELRFDNVEEMQAQLEAWKLPSWLVGREAAQTSTDSVREKSTPRARSLGPARELPPADNATELFKERLEALLKSAELLKHMDEGLRGRHFIRQDVGTAAVWFSRAAMSKEGWEAVCEQYGLDPEDEHGDYWDPNALTLLSGGVALSPQETEAILIAVYALADGDMEALLNRLPPDSTSIGTEVWEEIRQYVAGSRADGDKRDGLRVLARQLVTWVRGSEVRPGKPSGLSKADHDFARTITHYRKQGLTDEEIARRAWYRKKDDGTSYSTKDVTELRDLNL
jgi:hypothetical protein